MSGETLGSVANAALLILLSVIALGLAWTDVTVAVLCR